MEFFKKATSIDFMNLRRQAGMISLILALVSLVTLAVRGLNFGLDFTGGTQVELHFDAPIVVEDLRARLEASGFDRIAAQSYGSSEQVLLSLPETRDREALRTRLLGLCPGSHIERIDFMGPKMGQELLQQGILAVFLSMLAILVYIMMRFESRLAVGAIVALLHDPILILGVFSLTRLEFDLVALGGLLAVMGYSLNDTIVVFDRFREDYLVMPRSQPDEVMNHAINATLSRTLMTSGLTLLVVIALWAFAGPLLRGFSVALFVGILVGTYSSIFVAGGLAVSLGIRREALLPKKKRLPEDGVV